MAVSFIAAGVVWRWLMNPAPGDRATGLNVVFDKLGLGFLGNQWYLDPNWGMAAMALPAIWALSGYVMALFLAGFRGVPEELREAARMDGASEFRVYRHVVFPHLRPVTLSALIILGHISIKVFDLIVAIGGKQLHHADARGLHVDPDLRRARLREGRRDRDAAADRHLGADRSVPHLHGALGAERMTSTAAPIPVAPARGASRRPRRSDSAASLKYVLLLVFLLIILMPVYVLIVTSFKGVAETDPEPRVGLPHTWTLDGWREAWTSPARPRSATASSSRSRPR